MNLTVCLPKKKSSVKLLPKWKSLQKGKAVFNRGFKPLGIAESALNGRNKANSLLAGCGYNPVLADFNKEWDNIRDSIKA